MAQLCGMWAGPASTGVASYKFTSLAVSARLKRVETDAPCAKAYLEDLAVDPPHRPSVKVATTEKPVI